MKRSVIMLGPLVAVLFWVGLSQRSPASKHDSSSALTSIPKALVHLQPTRGGALVVDKSRAEMGYFESHDGKIEKVKTYKIATGKNHGNKSNQGDNRTPEGIYFFPEFKDPKILAPKYGLGAFVTDYPNTFDRFFGKTGGGIWLHGTNQEYRVDQRFDSEGCVVVENEDLIDLEKRVRILETPMIVYNEMPTMSTDDQDSMRGQLLRFLEDWRVGWETKNIDLYMDHYSKTRFTARGMNWNSWKAYKASLNQNYDKISVILSEPRIFVFHPYAYILFTQTYSSANINDSGQKKLALLYETDGGWKIVEETFFKLPTPNQREVTSDDLKKRIAETL